MDEPTLLDVAHAQMIADHDDNAARLGFYGALADAELFVLLTDEAAGDRISPEILELEGEKYALIFDREDRLADFAANSIPQPCLDGPANDTPKTPQNATSAAPHAAPYAAPYAALPTRAIAAMLAGENMGFGLNLGVAPSSILIPASAVTWLLQTLAETPESVADAGGVAPLTFSEMEHAVAGLLPALGEKLRFAAGHIGGAYLASSLDEHGAKATLLGCIDVPDFAQPAIARAAQEAMIFTGLDAPMMHVVFLTDGAPQAKVLAEIGTQIALPAPLAEPQQQIIQAPGSDPDKPPILR